MSLISFFVKDSALYISSHRFSVKKIKPHFFQVLRFLTTKEAKFCISFHLNGLRSPISPIIHSSSTAAIPLEREREREEELPMNWKRITQNVSKNTIWSTIFKISKFFVHSNSLSIKG
ncbi:hypothetical protein ACOSQ4_030632 [Xanthoceras sorbifolium]